MAECTEDAGFRGAVKGAGRRARPETVLCDARRDFGGQVGNNVNPRRFATGWDTEVEKLWCGEVGRGNSVRGRQQGVEGL